MATFAADVEWTGTTASRTYSRDHVVRIRNQTIRGSAPARYAGDDDLANPEQMLAAAIAQCQMLSYLAFASSSGLDVLSYRDCAEAIADKKDGKMQVVGVILRPVITLAAGSDMRKAELLVQRAHLSCFIANSVKSEVTINPTMSLAGL